MTFSARCGLECVIPLDTSHAHPLSLSERPDRAWVIDHRVVRSIAEGGHKSSHPFHFKGAGATVEVRAGLLRQIRDSQSPHVVPVDGVCECSFVSPLVPGRPIYDFGLAADGNRLIHPQERRISWPASVLERHLAELAMGLTELHELGIAHGDPALMNAYVIENNDTGRAIWVDLNSVQPATEESVAVDIAAFEATCLWPALLEADVHSQSLFDDLADIAGNATEPLPSYAIALTKERGDHRAADPRADLLEDLARADPSARNDALGATRRRVLGAMAPTYFLDQTRSDQNARFFSATLGMERARHVLLEEERTRLHGIRFQGEIAALQQLIEELNAETAELQSDLSTEGLAVAETRAALDETRTELDETRTELDETRTELDHTSLRYQGEIEELKAKTAELQSELSNESARFTNELNTIYSSRAWRLVSRFRSIKGLPRKAVSSFQSAKTTDRLSDELAKQRAIGASAKNHRIESYPFLVSVIMPVYNKGATLRSSVESVQNQTLRPVEIVIWDDGSDDSATRKSIEEIARLPSVSAFRGPNQGVVSARNSAIAFSRGKYICCLDPDDQIEPTYLEKAVALLESHPEYAITYPWVHSIGDVDELWETEDLDASLIMKVNHVPTCAVFRREVFDETSGFSPEMAHGYEDWEFWAHAAALGFRGKAIPEHLFKYSFSADKSASRDALARESHQDLIDRIATLHPSLAQTGLAPHREMVATIHPVGEELGLRRLPGGNGRPVVVTLPWFTVGGADRVVELTLRNWVDQGRTVVVFTTTPLAEGMADRRHELSTITPFVYSLHEFLPQHLWYDFVSATIGALPSPVLFNVGSSWFYENVRTLRKDFPHLRIADQQFNTIGHLEENRAAAGDLDLTIAAYDGLAEELANDGRVSRIASVYVGIGDIAVPDPEEVSAFRNEVGLDRGEKLVLYVGRLSEEKRPDWALRLADALPDDEVARIVIIGDGPLRERAADVVKGNERVIWMSDREDVQPAIAAADLLVVPSRIEGIPLVVLEALALGTPVVATRVGGVPDLEEETGILLADPEDFSSFVSMARHALRKEWNGIYLPERFAAATMLAKYEKLLFGDEYEQDSSGEKVDDLT